jgi:hypothetical protein
MADVTLDELLDGRDKLLTSSEVADILNVNQNTLYLWRQSPEVCSVLPFQRFIAPGQVRGMIRYRQSDVERFISAAASRGRQDAQASADALSSFDDVQSGAPQPRTVDPELLHDFEEALEAASDDDASNAALLRDLLNNLSDDG